MPRGRHGLVLRLAAGPRGNRNSDRENGQPNEQSDERQGAERKRGSLRLGPRPGLARDLKELSTELHKLGDKQRENVIAGYTVNNPFPSGSRTKLGEPVMPRKVSSRWKSSLT